MNRFLGGLTKSVRKPWHIYPVDRRHRRPGQDHFRPLSAIANVPLDAAGYGIVGQFLISWLIAVLVRKVAHIEEHWSANLADGVTSGGVARDTPRKD